MVLAEVNIAQGNFSAAYEHLKPVCYRWSASTRVWNTYCRSCHPANPAHPALHVMVL